MSIKEELMQIHDIEVDIQVVKISENQVDVIIAGEKAILEAFISVYDNLMYVKNSKFGFPIVVAPDFTSVEQAKIWKEYWDRSLAHPEKSCKTCPSINEFFSTFLKQRKKYSSQEKT